jgi:hypothetical protein
MARDRPIPNRLIEPQTKRRRLEGEVFGYPGTAENYLAEAPRRPDFVPGDPATLERTRKTKARTERLRASPGRKRRG